MYPPCRSTQAKAFDARRVARFVLAAAVFARAPAELPAPGERAPVPCGVASVRVVRLLVANGAVMAQNALEEAAADAGAIWAGAGVRLTWTFAPTSFERTGEDTVIVVIR